MSTNGDMNSPQKPITIASDSEDDGDDDCVIDEAATAKTQTEARKDLLMGIELVNLSEGDRRLATSGGFANGQVPTCEEAPEEEEARYARPAWVDPLDDARVKELFRATCKEDWQTDEKEFAARAGIQWTRYLGALFNLEGQLHDKSMLSTESIYAGLILCLGDLATDTIWVATSLVLDGDLEAESANQNIRDRAAFDERRFHVYAVLWQKVTKHWAVAVVDMDRTSPRCYYIDTWEKDRRQRMNKFRHGAFRTYFSWWGCQGPWLDAIKWYRVGCKQQNANWECGVLSIETARVMLREKTGLAASPEEWAKAGWQDSRLIRRPTDASNDERAVVTAWLDAIRRHFDTATALRVGRPLGRPASHYGKPATKFKIVKEMRRGDTQKPNWAWSHMTLGPAKAQAFVDQQDAMDWDAFDMQNVKRGGQKENAQPQQKKRRA
jgi:hypothetical protein